MLLENVLYLGNHYFISHPASIYVRGCICFYFVFQVYERMNVADALVTRQYQDGEQIIKEVSSLVLKCHPLNIVLVVVIDFMTHSLTSSQGLYMFMTQRAVSVVGVLSVTVGMVKARMNG